MRSQQAFTLIEMLVTLLIMAIFATISLPAWRDFLNRSEDQVMQSQILNAIQFARLEVQARNTPIAICPSQNQMTCSGSWSDGMLIFVDENENGIVDNKQQILAVIKIRKKNGLLHWRSFPHYRHYLLFSPTHVAQSDNGTFWYCHANAPVWAIMISKTGRARVLYTDHDGSIKDGSGKALVCD